jgi:hypothetical protein
LLQCNIISEIFRGADAAWRRTDLLFLEIFRMPNLLRQISLSGALLAGLCGVAQAQSVAALPPQGGMPAQTAVTLPYGSNQSYYPKPGGNPVWKEENYRPPADYATNQADHPYSTSIGPKPGAHSSGTDERFGTPPGWNSNANMHPYTSGEGPKPN